MEQAELITRGLRKARLIPFGIYRGSKFPGTLPLPPQLTSPASLTIVSPFLLLFFSFLDINEGRSRLQSINEDYVARQFLVKVKVKKLRRYDRAINVF